MTHFRSLSLPDFLIGSLDRLGITTPTPIQVSAIPPALEGLDILASAKTGSGKTIAYLIPLIIKLLNMPTSKALVLLPTRELALQVRDALNQMVNVAKVHASVLIGGEPIGRQFAQLKRRPNVIIGTPGRICDHLDRGSLLLNQVRFLVLDEMDRMLDMGFSEQLGMIHQCLPDDRQTLMFSATLPPNIKKLSQKYLNDPRYISLDSTSQAAAEIKQEMVRTSHTNKFDCLLKELDQREGSIIVFVKTKRGAEHLANKLRGKNHNADAIHGDLQQRKRERVVQAFRRQKSRIMVATDIAARGLDIPHIQHVINYDLPHCPEDYIHRIGRTGRAGATGCALSLVSPEETGKWKRIHQFMQPQPKASGSHHQKVTQPGKSSGGFRKKAAPSKKFGSYQKAAQSKEPGSFQRNSQSNESGSFRRAVQSKDSGLSKEPGSHQRSSQSNKLGSFRGAVQSKDSGAYQRGSQSRDSGSFQRNTQSKESATSHQRNSQRQDTRSYQKDTPRKQSPKKARFSRRP